MIEDLWKEAEKKSIEVKLPNPAKPEYPIITNVDIVTFKVLYQQVLPIAKEDGCLFVPYEETTEAARKKVAEENDKGNLAADDDP